MTRIIAGSAGSLRLATPGPTTRPTSDRVREAIFSRLEAREGFHGTILDLFAGTGALGLEAASRGARHVVMVEHHSGAQKVIRRNIATVSPTLPSATTLQAVSARVESYLQAPPTLTVDGVFLDPPYEFEGIEDVLSALEPWLTNGAWVVIERSTRSRAPAWPAGFEPWEDKKYGDTVVYSATWSPKGSQPPSED